MQPDELEKWYHKLQQGMTKGCCKSKVHCGRAKHEWSFQWMKGFFWNLDPAARVVVPRQQAEAAQSKSVSP